MNKDPYRNISKFYDSLFQTMNAGLFSLGMKMHPPFDGMSVLDVGCGTGMQLDRYQQAGCQVFGIDPSPSMLKIAADKLGDSAQLQPWDAADMPYESETFDLVTTTLVLHEMSPHIRDKVLQEMKRVLKKNGRLLLIDFHTGPYKPIGGWFNKLFITLTEIGAGREHFQNYRDFMARQGLPGLTSSHNLEIDQQRIVSGGNMAIFLVH